MAAARGYLDAAVGLTGDLDDGGGAHAWALHLPGLAAHLQADYATALIHFTPPVSAV